MRIEVIDFEVYKAEQPANGGPTTPTNSSPRTSMFVSLLIGCLTATTIVGVLAAKRATKPD
jgi:hypothetical protein